MSKIRVVLPKKYDLVVGDTFQLFYRGVIEAPNPFCYSIVVVCDKGKSFPRYFEYLPEEVGSHKLTISVYDAERNLLGNGETVLNVVSPARPDKPLNILCIGDSLTQGGEWVSEANRRLTKKDGEPKGLGFEGISFVGDCKKDEVGFEAFGGWRWDNFISCAEGAMWVEVKNCKTSEDQHSLWQDENGAIWQLETLQTDYLKFNRYKYHTSPRPEKGTVLTHYKNAVNQSPIVIGDTFTERTSPFLNTDNGEIDFKAYCEKINTEKLDYVYILLGGNGLMSIEAMTLSRADFCKTIVAKGKILVDKIKGAFPDVKVRVIAPQLPSIHGGVGWNQGAELPFTDSYEIQTYHMELNLAYEAWTLEPEYRDFMEFINLSGQFDSDYNYPSIQKPVNTRNKLTEKMDTNAQHPTFEGYMQIADAVYRNIVHSIKREI